MNITTEITKRNDACTSCYPINYRICLSWNIAKHHSAVLDFGGQHMDILYNCIIFLVLSIWVFVDSLNDWLSIWFNYNIFEVVMRYIPDCFSNGQSFPVDADKLLMLATATWTTTPWLSLHIKAILLVWECILKAASQLNLSWPGLCSSQYFELDCCPDSEVFLSCCISTISCHYCGALLDMSTGSVESVIKTCLFLEFQSCQQIVATISKPYWAFVELRKATVRS